MYKRLLMLTVIVLLFAGYAGAGVPGDGIWWYNLEMGRKQIF
ncbi:MAG: hypothetical protein P8X85_23560 [Desulfobacterales bacterium]